MSWDDDLPKCEDCGENPAITTQYDSVGQVQEVCMQCALIP